MGEGGEILIGLEETTWCCDRCHTGSLQGPSWQLLTVFERIETSPDLQNRKPSLDIDTGLSPFELQSC